MHDTLSLCAIQRPSALSTESGYRQKQPQIITEIFREEKNIASKCQGGVTQLGIGSRRYAPDSRGRWKGRLP